MVQLLNPLTAGAYVRQHLFDPETIYHAQAFAADPQLDPALLTFQPEPAPVQIRHKPPLGLVIRMGNIVPDQRSFTGNLADL
jgi:hypothetical protein